MVTGDAESKSLRFYLFRDFQIQVGEDILNGLEAEKPRELLCYLLLHRERPFLRDGLATLLWEDNDANHARKNFRQALWQLQTELRNLMGSLGERLLLVEGEWIRINEAKLIWSDVDHFQQVFKNTQGVPGYDLGDPQARALKECADLYKGGLLEGWYHDWCLFERERLQNIYLMVLDKLMDYCQANSLYEDGIVHGMQVLQIDSAREKTHRCLMKLYYEAGDRTNALRQYDRCVEVLEKELQVGPSQATIELDEHIRNDRINQPGGPSLAQSRQGQKNSQPALVSSLNQIRQHLSESHLRASQEIETIIDGILNPK